MTTAMDGGNKEFSREERLAYGIELEPDPVDAGSLGIFEGEHDQQPEPDESSAPPENSNGKAKGKRKRAPKKPPVVVSSDLTDLRAAHARTDATNGRRFALLHGDDARWCEPWRKWLAWDGRRWVSGAECAVAAMAKEVGQAVCMQTADFLPILDPVTARELMGFARMTSSARGISSMLTLARSEAGLSLVPSELNCNPWLLNCLNGTIDLKTGESRPHDRADFLTTLCPTEYHPDAECPQWIETVSLILGRRESLIRFMQRLLGSAIVGAVIEHIIVILFGGGSNGKGLMLETVLDALGEDYACKIASEMLLASKGDRHPTERADLFGKRLVVASETDDGRRLAEGLVKELTGGDRIKGRRMHEDFWQFVPSHTLLLLTNHKPRVYGNDHAIWRRLCLVPFDQKFWDADRGETGPVELKADKHLREKLRAEHAGILRWLVQGCLDWQANGLGQPEEVTAATADYRADQDVLAAFLAECCLFGEQWTAKASDVRARYETFCKSNGDKALSGRRFGQLHKGRQFRPRLRMDERLWHLGNQQQSIAVHVCWRGGKYNGAPRCTFHHDRRRQFSARHKRLSV